MATEKINGFMDGRMDSIHFGESATFVRADLFFPLLSFGQTLSMLTTTKKKVRCKMVKSPAASPVPAVTRCCHRRRIVRIHRDSVTLIPGVFSPVANLCVCRRCENDAVPNKLATKWHPGHPSPITLCPDKRCGNSETRSPPSLGEGGAAAAAAAGSGTMFACEGNASNYSYDPTTH